jgi:hypothetical protein
MQTEYKARAREHLNEFSANCEISMVPSHQLPEDGKFLLIEGGNSYRRMGSMRAEPYGAFDTYFAWASSCSVSLAARSGLT